MAQKRFKDAARKAIDTLFSYASKNPAAASRSVQLAAKYSSRYKVPFTREQKSQYCKYCGNYLIPGKNSRVRIHRNRIIRTCLLCNRFRRVPITKRSNRQ